MSCSNSVKHNGLILAENCIKIINFGNSTTPFSNHQSCDSFVVVQEIGRTVKIQDPVTYCKINYHKL